MAGAVGAHFAESYTAARRKFVARAVAAGAEVDSHRHPLDGPGGEPLYVDIARLGSAGARRILLTCSGTHGVEGFCGSACQSGWLEEKGAAALPAGMAMVMVHAINPFGFAWLRRVNEDNVDVNRNFIDFDQGVPENEAWVELAAAVCPELWDEAAASVFRATCKAFVERHGERAFVKAITGGQYSHADGVFFGGRAPVWSHRLLKRYAEETLAAVEALAVVDFHTGLGPFGYGELICRHPPDDEALRLARRWFGDAVTSPALGESASPVATGNLRMAFVDWLAEASVVAVGLEFGTHAEDKVFEAIRADNWLHCHGDLESRAGHAIKANIREMFYPATDGWKELVYRRGLEVQEQALQGLAAM
ncbi:MAG: M14 family metallopeptidase [Alphaproteobacteria bacterium]|jgi:hypothetical protein|nr:M14 family metallopeptidase [Alphaproteobacteria bacterium]